MAGGGGGHDFGVGAGGAGGHHLDDGAGAGATRDVDFSEGVPELGEPGGGDEDGDGGFVA